MNKDAFFDELAYYQGRNKDQLTTWIETLGAPNSRLVEAMKYGCLLGGKRIRPYLTYRVGRLFGVDEENLDTPAAAVECIHAYSLIHDDLPAMDDDNLRRGQPTCHLAFDEASAILAGDALQSLAFSILAQGQLHPRAEHTRIQMIQCLAEASGANGMCFGQALDLESEGKEISLSQLETIHRNKTGALIRCAIRLGAYAAGEQGISYLPQLDTFANAIGLAFQVRDDILDITSNTETLGKPQGSDLEADKITYPALLGLQGAQQKATHLLEESLAALHSIPYQTKQLEFFARYMIERNC